MVRFESVRELIAQAEAEHQTISQITLAQTASDLDKTAEAVYTQMSEYLQVMRESIESGLNKDLRSVSGLSGGMAWQFKQHVENGGSLSGGFVGEIIYSALAVSELNACMGRIVAAPTAGSSGIIPACLLVLQKHFHIPEEKIVMGLFNASAIGMVIAKNASIAGAKGGCQAECGSAAAMAASAMVEIMGGAPEYCGHAVAQALKSLMGLVCDPVAGLVEEPCVIRNCSSASVAVVSAELALAGIKSAIPADEVIFAMDAVGRAMPEDLRETANGGIAMSETAQRISRELQGRSKP